MDDLPLWLSWLESFNNTPNFGNVSRTMSYLRVSYVNHKIEMVRKVQFNGRVWFDELRMQENVSKDWILREGS